MRTLDAGNQSAIAAQATAPVYLVELGFDTPVRFSTRDTLTWDTHSWAEASLNVQHGDRPTVSVFNETSTLGQVALTEGTAGRSLKIWQTHEWQNKNILDSTNDFDASPWSKVGVTFTHNAILAPDGSQTGILVEEDGNLTQHRLQRYSMTESITSDRRASIYLKPRERHIFKAWSWSPSSEQMNWCNLLTGETGTTNPRAAEAPKLTPALNGWYRFEWTVNADRTHMGISLSDNVVLTSADYQGVPGYGMYYWGPQLEVGYNATPFEPVLASSVTSSGPAGHTDPVLIFDGEMSDATIGDRVTIMGKPYAPLRTPRHFAVPPIFNHVPPAGTRIETPKQIITLERD